MELTPVKSSHIAAIGHLEAERVLLVRYKDGSLYAWPEINAAEHSELMFAPSKGKWIKRLHGLNESHICDVKGVMPTESTTIKPVAAPGGNEAPSPGPLNVIDEDADKCCRKGFLKLGGTDLEWQSRAIVTCGECGQDFKPEMIGPNRYWRIVPQVHIVRPTR